MVSARAVGIAAGLLMLLWAKPVNSGIIYDGGGGDFLDMKQAARKEQTWVLPYPRIEGPMILHDTKKEAEAAGYFGPGPAHTNFVFRGYRITVPSEPYGHWCFDRLAEELCKRRRMRATSGEIRAASDSLSNQNSDVVGGNRDMILPGMTFEFTTEVEKIYSGNF